MENSKYSFCDCVSILDEVFAICSIERNWNIWQKEIDSDEKIKVRSGKYTTKKVKYDGWTPEGMDRLEELCRCVLSVRKKLNNEKVWNTHTR